MKMRRGKCRNCARLDGQTARGRLTVFWGSVILAEVPLTIRVDKSHQVKPAASATSMAFGRPYRKIFASYSHQDVAIVEEFERYFKTVGDEYLRDWIHLRAGEVWSEQLEELIREADIFQLFWSTNSMRSRFVRQEWQYALGLGRPNFLRPVYWEEPMPSDPAADLPPEALRRLQFQRLPAAGGAQAPPRPPAEARPVACPNCGRQSRGSVGTVGRSVRCSACGASFRIAGDAEGLASVPDGLGPAESAPLASPPACSLPPVQSAPRRSSAGSLIGCTIAVVLVAIAALPVLVQWVF